MSVAGTSRSRLPAGWRMALWTGMAAMLLAPAVAMRFTDEVNWGAGDFVAAAGLLGLAGIGLEFAARVQGSALKRISMAAAIVGLLLVVWAELAVGIL